LKDTNICGPGREDNEPSEGRSMSSWIWLVHKAPKTLEKSHPGSSTVHGTGANDSNNCTPDLLQRAASGEEVAVSIRAHWARCQARAEQYEEEVQLTLEEMWRTLQFFKWKSQWWLTLKDTRAGSATPPDPQVEHGLRAYAHRQASMYSQLVSIYVSHWRKFLVQRSLGADWLGLYPVAQPPNPVSNSEEGADGPLEGNANGDDGDGDDDDELDCENSIDLEFEEMFAGLPDN
jgi:hypothetical protein